MPGDISRGKEQSNPDFLDNEVDEMVKQNKAALEDSSDEGDEEDEEGKDDEETDEDDEDDGDDEDGEGDDDDEDDDDDDAGEDGDDLDGNDDPNEDDDEEVQEDEDISNKKKDKNKKSDKKGESAVPGNRDKRIKDLQSKTTKATTKAAVLKKENARLQDLVTNLSKASSSDPSTPGNAVKEKEKAVVDLTKNFADIEKEYPELIGPLKSVMKSLQTEITELKKGLLDQGKVVSDVKVSTSESTFWGKVERKVPDYDKALKSISFSEYVDDLKPRLKKSAMDTINNGTESEMIDLLLDFKETDYYAVGDAAPDIPVKKNKKKKTKGKESVLAQARKVSNPSFKKSSDIKTGKGKKVITRQDLRSMPKYGFKNDKEEADLDAAILAGRI